jgi:hypothetical protein
MSRGTIRHSFIIMAFGALSLSCGVSARSSAEVLIPPCPAPRSNVKSWSRIDAGKFHFLLPSDFREVKVQPIDSYVRCFQTRDSSIIVSFDWGSFSDPLTDNYASRQTESCSEQIGGRMARVVTSAPGDRPRMRYIAAAAWRDVTPGTHLTMFGSTTNRRGVRKLLAILRTVRFGD